MAGLTSYRPDRASSSMYPRTSASSWLDREKSSRSRLEEIRISIEGDIVL